MINSNTVLLDEIELFLKRSELSPTAFGERALNDRHLVRRLRDGGSCTLKTADKIRAFIAKWETPGKPRNEARSQLCGG